MESSGDGDKYDDLVREHAEYKSRCEDLENALEINTKSLLSATQELTELRNVEMESKRVLEGYRVDSAEMETTLSVLRDKIRLYMDDDVEAEMASDLDRALTALKQREYASHTECLGFLEPVNMIEDTAERKIKGLKTMNYHLTQEVERLGEMLGLENSIAKGLREEYDNLTRSSAAEKEKLLNEIRKVELESQHRLEKIRELEIERKELLYSC